MSPAVLTTLTDSPGVLAAGLAAVGVGLAVMIGAFVLNPEARQTGVSRSLAAMEAMRSSPESLRTQELELPFTERVLGPLMRAVLQLGRRLTPADQVTRMRKRLDLAGNPAGWDVDRIVSLRVLAAAFGVTASLIVCLASGVGLLRTVAVVVGLGALGWFVPAIVLSQMASKRSDRILKELPDALDLLTISVESGLGFDAAVAQVARNSDGELAQEFFRVLQEMQIGTGRMAALRGLGERTDVADLKTFVSAMVQADAYGVPIANVLRVQSDQMRLKRTQRAEEAAQKVPVKIVVPLIVGILPALFVAIIGPGAVSAYRAFTGT